MAELISCDTLRATLADSCDSSQIDTLLTQITAHGITAFQHNPQSIYTIMAEQCRLLDTLLYCLFPGHTGAALLATGGYGRKEIYPYSDLDLLILVEHEDDTGHNRAIETFIQRLWHGNRRIGHSVRTLEQAITDARSDTNLLTALLEARLISGPRRQFDSLMRTLGTSSLMSPQDFFHRKYQEQQTRNRRYSSNLEPDLKHSQGNLRYLHTILWLIRYCCHSRRISFLATSNIITHEEFFQLRNAHKELSRIRYALHILAQRNENRLLFEYQLKLAEWFHYPGSADQKPVEQFMRDYYQCTFEVKAFSKIIISAIAESLFIQPGAARVIPLGDTPFVTCNDLIDCQDHQADDLKPRYLFTPFVLLSAHSQLKGLTSRCVRVLMESASHKLPAFQYASTALRDNFIQLFKQPGHLAKQLQSMLSLGLLERYIPAFATVKGRMQFDLYHVHTVDQHIIQVVQMMQNLAEGMLNTTFPIIQRIYQRLKRPYLLYLGAFFHDLGKGSGYDHSEYGAELAWSFCRLHSLPEHDCQMVVWLTRYHLRMSQISQKQDIHDIEVIQKFATIADTQEKLDALLLLTVADMHGTNPSLWNNWKANLLLSLHHSTSRLLHANSLEALKQSRQDEIQEKKQAVINRLQLDAHSARVLQGFWEKWPEAYFQYNPTPVIKWHIEQIGIHEPRCEQAVMMRYYAHQRQCLLTTYLPQARHVFANIIQAIDECHLSVSEARVYTTADNWSLAQFILTQQDGSTISDNHFISQIRRQIQHRLAHPAPAAVHRRQSRRHPKNVFNVKTRVTLTNPANKPYSIIGVKTVDAPGVLLKITRVFSRHKLRTLQAKVNTIGETVEDYFFVTTHTDQPITHYQSQNAIIHHIRQTLNQAAG